MMHSAVTHHPPTDAQPVPSQQLPAPGSSLIFIAQHDAIRDGTFFRPFCVHSLGSVPTQLLVYPKPPLWQDSTGRIKVLGSL